MKHLILILILALACALSTNAQTATVEIYRQSFDSTIMVTIKWDRLTLTYQERQHHSFISEESDQSIDSSKQAAKIKNAYQLITIEKFTCNLSGTGTGPNHVQSPNSVLVAVNRAYAEMNNDLHLMKLVDSSLEVIPNLSNGRLTHARCSFLALWSHGKYGIDFSEDGPSARAVIEMVEYQGSSLDKTPYSYSFDSVPCNVPFKKIKVREKTLFEDLTNVDYFKYKKLDQTYFENLREIAFSETKKLSVKKH